MSSVISFTDKQNKSQTAGVTPQSSYGSTGISIANQFQIYKTTSEKDRAEQATQDALDTYSSALNSYVLPTFNEIAEADDLYDRKWNITPSAQTQLGKTIRGAYQSANRVESLKSWEFANVVAEITGTTPEYAKNNMKSLIKLYTGQDIDEATFANGLLKSAISKVVSNVAGYRTQLFTSSLAGLSEREQQQRIENYVNNELSKYKPYWNAEMYGYKDSALGNFLYFMAENSSDAIESLVLGAVVGGIGKIVKGSTQAVNFFDKLIRVSNVYFKEAGSAQMDMLEMTDVNGNRMSFDTIAKYSTAIGIVNTAFEFGLEKGFEMVGAKTVQMKTATKNLFKKYGKVSQKTIHDTGIETMSHYLGRKSWVTLKDSMAEGATEAMQTWSESFFTNLAYKKSKGFGDYVKSHKDILSEMAEVFTLTTLSTFVQAPLMNSTSSSNNGLSFLGYLKDVKTGNIVRVEDAKTYSKQSEGSTLVSINNVATKKEATKENKKTEKNKSVEAKDIKVYKVGDVYIPVSEEDYQAVSNAVGNTTGIYVNVVQGKDIKAEQAVLDSATSLDKLGIDTKNVTGYTKDSVVVPSDKIASFTTSLMKKGDIVSVVTKKDGKAVNGGNFDEATIYLKDKSGETVSVNIITEKQAQSQNLTIEAIEDINDKKNAQTKNEFINRAKGIIDERVKKSKTITNSEKAMDNVFNASTEKMSKKEKSDVKKVRSVLFNSLYDKTYKAKSFTKNNAKAIASINATLLNLFAKVNGTDIKSYVKENLGFDIDNPKGAKPFINLMTKADVIANNATPAFIERNSDGTWTVNLFAGVGTKNNTQANLTHEFGHMFLSTIKDDSVLDAFKRIYKSEYEEGGILGDKFQENFCNDLEIYIASGYARNLEVRNVFEMIVGAMTDFIEYIRGMEFENKQDVLDAFDYLFDETAIENRNRARTADTNITTLTETLSKVGEKIKGKSETIDELVSDVSVASDIVRLDYSEEGSWFDLKTAIENLREQIQADKPLSTDSDVKALLSVISEQNVAELMNNRPIVTQKIIKQQKVQPVKYNKLVDPVVDKELYKKLENCETVKLYRTMQLIDGELYPPMAEFVDKKRQQPTIIDNWYQSDERPDLAFTKKDKKTGDIERWEDGSPKYYFKLDKKFTDTKGGDGPIDALYNPYWHSSKGILNDQLNSAYRRSNLVVVEVEVPVFELKGEYKAEKAADPTGPKEWTSGTVNNKLAEITGERREVVLSRYNKVTRILSSKEVAQGIANMLKGTDIAIPDSVVTPQVLYELKKLGVKIEETEKVKEYKALFGDGYNPKASRTQMNMGANPSIEVNLLEGYHSDVPSDTTSESYKKWLKDRKDFAEDITKALRDKKGKDIINKALGLQSIRIGDKDYNHGVGIYYGSDGKRRASIGQQDFIKPEYDENGNLTKDFCAKMDLSCLLHAIVLRQDAVTWGQYQLDKSKDVNKQDAIGYIVKENVPMDKANALIKALEEECDRQGFENKGAFCFIPNPHGFAINNYSDLNNAEFQTTVKQIVEKWANEYYNKNDIEEVFLNYDSGESKAGGYITADFPKKGEGAENGYSTPQRTLGASEKSILWDVRNKLLSNSFQEVYEKYSEKWGNAGTVPTGNQEIDLLLSSLSLQDLKEWTKTESKLLIGKNSTLRKLEGVKYFDFIAKKAGIQTSDAKPLRFNKTVYHGTNAVFSRFDRRFALDGSGGQDYGAGTYTTENINIAKAYAQEAQFKDSDVESWIVDMPQNIAKSKEEIKALDEQIEKIENLINYIKENNKDKYANAPLGLQLDLHEAERRKIVAEKSIIQDRIEIASQLNDKLKYRKVSAEAYAESLFSAKESEKERELSNVRLDVYKDILARIKKGDIKKQEGLSIEESILDEYGDELFPSYFINIAEKARNNWRNKNDSTLLSPKGFETEDDYVLACLKEGLEGGIKGVEGHIKLLTDIINEPAVDMQEVYKRLPKEAVEVVEDIVNGKYIPEDNIADITKDLPPRQVYKVEIPDDKDLNYLDWDATLVKTFGLDEDWSDSEGASDERIVKADMYERLYDELSSYFDRETALEILQSETVEKMYNSIVFEMADWDAERRASDLLARAGFVGIKSGDIYTVFNEDDAQILDRYEYRTDEEGRKYNKKLNNGKIGYTAYGSVLVPYTPEQIAGRIRQGQAVEASHLVALLETNKDNAEFNARYRTALENELNSIRILTANPILNRTILDEYNKLYKEKGEVDKDVLYENVKAEMKKIDDSFDKSIKFTKKAGKPLIDRAIAHAGWETTETRNANFLAEYNSKEKINELALYYADNGYFSNELRYFPVENLKMLAMNLKYGTGRITDKTYASIRKELSDPMFTTALRIASNGKITYEDTKNVYHGTSVEINNEEFAKAITDSRLPEEWRKALKTGAYNDNLLQEINKYIAELERREIEQEEKITDLTDSEKALKQEIREIEARHNAGAQSALNAMWKLTNLKEKFETQYKGGFIKMKMYHRNLRRCENALERVAAKNVVLQAKMIKERIVRKMDTEITLNRKTQDHATGRRMESLYQDLRTPKSVIQNAIKNGGGIELTADIKDIQRDYPKIVTFLQQKGLLDSDGLLIGNIADLTLEDTYTLYDLLRAYKAEAKRVLKEREDTKKREASYLATEIKKDMTVKNQWKLSEEEQETISQNARREAEAWAESEKENNIIHTQDEIDTMAESIRLSTIAEKELGNAKQEARPANAEYKDTLKESKRKTTNREFNIPRRVLRKINPTLERIIMGGYDADGNETIGIEQLTDKEETGIRQRADGLRNKMLSLYRDVLKKKGKDGDISKMDMFNIFSANKSLLKDSETEIYFTSENEDGSVRYSMTDGYNELIKQARKEGDISKANVLDNIYKVATQQAKRGFESGQEIYNYTLEEKMAIYLMLRQEGYAYALWRGNNISASKMLEVYEEFVNADPNSDMGKAKQLADYLQKDAESRYPEINPISIKLDNKDMSDIKVMDYFGIFYDLDSNYDGLSISLSEDGQRPSTFTLADGFLHDREGGTKALRLDILNTWAKQVQRQEHYIAFAEYFDKIRRIMNDDGVYEDIKNQNGIGVAKWVNDFLRIISKSNSSVAGVDETISNVFKSMRSSLAKSALSFNIAPAILSQVTTLTYAISEGISMGDMFGAMKEVILHPKKTSEYINSLSAQMKAQKRIDVAIAKTNDIDLSTKAGKAKYYINAATDIGMKPLEAFDTGVKNILWLAKYNQQVRYYKNLATQSTDEGLSVKKQIENDSDYITRRATFDANVFVLDSQQSTLAKNNPTIYATNNDLVRSVLMFSSQSTKQAFYHLDNLEGQQFWATGISDTERGKRAMTWFRNMIGYSMAVALTCAVSGKIMKGDDEEWDDWLLKVIRAMGGEVLTEVPVIGQLISQYDNGWNSSVTIPIGTVAQQGYNLISKLTEEEKANGKTRWEKASTALKNLAFEAGAFSGLPEAQIKKLYNAFAERNFLYVLGYDWGEWLDDLMD